MGLVISKNGIIQDYSRSRSQSNSSSVQKRKSQEKNDEDNSREEAGHKQRGNPYKTAINSYKDQKHERTKANSIASLSPVTASIDDTVETALTTMRKYQIHHLLFVDRNKALLGIISDRDLLDKRRSDKAFSFASKEVIAAKESTEIKIICSIMIEKLVSAVPLVNEEGQLSGIVTKTDLLEHVFKSQNLQVYV